MGIPNELFKDINLIEEQEVKVRHVFDKVISNILAEIDDDKIINDALEMSKTDRDESMLGETEIATITGPLVEHLNSFFLVGYDLMGNGFEYTNYPSELSRDAIGKRVEKAPQNKRMEEMPMGGFMDIFGMGPPPEE